MINEVYDSVDAANEFKQRCGDWIWEIPDQPEVPTSFVGLRTRIHHDSDLEVSVLRTCALRTIPENNTD